MWTLWKYSATVLFTSFLIWRNGRAVKQFIVQREFPPGHYALGDANTQCALKHAPGPDLRFCEDATFWDIRSAANELTQRHVLVNCDAGRKAWNTVLGPLLNPDPHGSIWLLAGKTGPDTVPQRVTFHGYPSNHDFHPLGMEISPSVDGNASNLYVVNHARQKTFIEQFTLSPASPSVATHVRTLTSPYFVSPNAIALTSPNSFYVTNDHLMTRRLPFFLGKILPLLETLLGLPLSWVSHISLDPDPLAATPIVDHKFSALFIPFANGISISPSGSEVAVASTSLSQVLIYSRDAVSNGLKHIHTVPVPFCADNLMFDETGDLIVAGHPSFIKVIKVAADKTNEILSPSWIVAIKPHTYELETLFLSNGSTFSSSSTALRDLDGALYVTGLYAEGVMVCRP